ncbi:Mmd [Columba guinea]|nr:Mmd [Columba guinea]
MELHTPSLLSCAHPASKHSDADQSQHMVAQPFSFPAPPTAAGEGSQQGVCSRGPCRHPASDPAGGDAAGLPRHPLGKGARLCLRKLLRPAGEKDYCCVRGPCLGALISADHLASSAMFTLRLQKDIAFTSLSKRRFYPNAIIWLQFFGADTCQEALESSIWSLTQAVDRAHSNVSIESFLISHQQLCNFQPSRQSTQVTMADKKLTDEADDFTANCIKQLVSSFQKACSGIQAFQQLPMGQSLIGVSQITRLHHWNAIDFHPPREVRLDVFICGTLKRSFINFPKNTSLLFNRFMNHPAPANSRYKPTCYEHAANCYTHALLIVPAIVGSALLHRLSDDRWEKITAWMYGMGLCALFIVSTVFHIVSWKKSHLRTMEHCFHMCDRMMIYVFIAASYAPWLNLRELGPLASHMRWFIWLMAAGGTIYVFLYHEKYKIVELFFYLAMGFSPALVVTSMSNTDGLQEVAWGGLIYCLGVVFFKSDGVIPFAHAIWHLFVATAAAVHYYAIWKYLYRSPADIIRHL